MGERLTGATLAWQNHLFVDTGGVSANCSNQDFVAAFKDELSGETCPSRFEDGRPASVHLLDGVPDHWVISRDEDNHIIEVLDSVIAGFLRNGRFYTRDEVAELVSVPNHI